MAVYDEIRLNCNDPCGKNWVITAEKNRFGVEINKYRVKKGIKNVADNCNQWIILLILATSIKK